MLCAHCQSAVLVDPLEDPPSACPHCGAPLDTNPDDQVARFEPFDDDEPAVTVEPMVMAPVATAVAAPVAPVLAGESTSAEKASKAKPAKAKSRGWLSDVLLSFLLVGLGTLTAGSTYLALQAVKQRDRAQGDADLTADALDKVLMAAASTSRLKGPLPATAEARTQIFSPAVAYLQQYVTVHKDDKELLPQVAGKYFSLAGLQAKLGDSACVSNLQGGIAALNVMADGDFKPADFPSIQSALRLSTPNDWASVKTTNLQMHAISLVISIGQAVSAYTKLITKFPEEPLFRDDLAGVYRISASLQSQVEERKPAALDSWKSAAEQLEKLNQLQPNNVDHQNRLIEALLGAARLQLEAGQNDDAIVKMTRAVAVQEQMVAAKPDDKKLAEELAKTKQELAAIKPGTPAPAAEAAPAEEPPAPAEEPAAE